MPKRSRSFARAWCSSAGRLSGYSFTDPAAPPARPTDDIDAIARTFTRAQYRTLCDRLRELGFREDLDGPVCRWRIGEIKLDLMPPIAAILGFSNRWYGAALAHAEAHDPGGLKVDVVSAPYAMATKLEAFDGRGNGDHAASHDLEDFIQLVDGREGVIDELRAAEAGVRDFVARRTAALLANRSFRESIPGHLPGDEASQARLTILVERLREIASTRSKRRPRSRGPR